MNISGRMDHSSSITLILYIYTNNIEARNLTSFNLHLRHSILDEHKTERMKDLAQDISFRILI